MIPRKPAPHLMRGGSRFPACAKPLHGLSLGLDASAGEGRSEKIMLQQKAMVQAEFRIDGDLTGLQEDPAAQIPRLEAEIDRLARVAESCRKVILAAILGGIAAAGFNSRTLRDAIANIRAAEARRAELIGALPFSAVIEETKL